MHLFQLLHIFVGCLTLPTLTVAGTIALVHWAVPTVGATKQTLVWIRVHEMCDAKGSRDTVLPRPVRRQAHGVGTHA